MNRFLFQHMNGIHYIIVANTKAVHPDHNNNQPLPWRQLEDIQRVTILPVDRSYILGLPVREYS